MTASGASERLRPPSSHRVAFGLTALAATAGDQTSKHWALSALDDGPIDLVGSLRLSLTFNDSAAFSLGGGRTTLIAVLALVVSAVIARLGWRADSRQWAIGLGFILGGALGNLVDRALRSGSGVLGGHVVDFIDLGWWPVFNLADTFLWVGVGLLVLASWRRGAEES